MRDFIMKFPKRKPTRLKGYDYSSNNSYFVTVCSYDRQPVFGHISAVGQGLAPAEMHLSEYGQIAREQILDLEKRYPFLKIEKYIIMPDHIHMILMFNKEFRTAGASPCPTGEESAILKVTLSDVMCTFKSLATRACKLKGFDGKLFQSSFNDEVIRNLQHYDEVWKYIDTNILRWQLEKYSDENSHD